MAKIKETAYYNVIMGQEGIIRRAFSGTFAILASIVALGINLGHFSSRFPNIRAETI